MDRRQSSQERGLPNAAVKLSSLPGGKDERLPPYGAQKSGPLPPGTDAPGLGQKPDGSRTGLWRDAVLFDYFRGGKDNGNILSAQTQELCLGDQFVICQQED